MNADRRPRFRSHWQIHYGRMSSSESHRVVARNAGFDDPSDAAVGTAARPWHWSGDPDQFAGHDPGGAWLALSGTSPIGTARLAGSGMEDVGGEPSSPVLSAVPEG